MAYFFFSKRKKLKFIFFKLWSEEQFPLPPENTKTVDHTRSEPRTSFRPEFEKPVSQGPMKSRIPLPVKKTVVPKFEESVGRERAKFDFQRTSDSCKNKKWYYILIYHKWISSIVSIIPHIVGVWALAANPFAATQFVRCSSLFCCKWFSCKWSFSLQMVAASGFAASVPFCGKWP